MSDDPKDHDPQDHDGPKGDPHEVPDHPDPHPSDGPKGVEAPAGPTGSKDPKN